MSGNLLTVLAASAGVAMVLGVVPAKGAVDAYIPNNASHTVSVIDTKTNSVTDADFRRQFPRLEIAISPKR